jgi:hypothetical protein
MGFTKNGMLFCEQVSTSHEPWTSEHECEKLFSINIIHVKGYILNKFWWCGRTLSNTIKYFSMSPTYPCGIQLLQIVGIKMVLVCVISHSTHEIKYKTYWRHRSKVQSPMKSINKSIGWRPSIGHLAYQ